MPWKAPSVLCWLATAQVAGCLRAPLRLHGTVVLHAPHRTSHAARMVADDDDTAAAADIATDAETRRRGIGVWQKLRERRAAAGASTSEDSADDDEPLLEGIAKDIDTAIERRRRRLNTRLASSLKTFRKEVLDEVSAQSNEQKARQERLKERQSAFTAALDGLREDLLDDIGARAAFCLSLARAAPTSGRRGPAEWLRGNPGPMSASGSPSALRRPSVCLTHARQL